MVEAAKRICGGCRAVVRGDCPACSAKRRAAMAERMRAVDARRGSASSRGYGGAWRKFRLQYLAANPYCAMCEREGRSVVATVVDHVEPHKGDRDKFWDEDNMQALCGRCHAAKTLEEARRCKTR